MSIMPLQKTRRTALLLAFLILTATGGLLFTPESDGVPSYVERLPEDRQDEGCNACHLPEDGGSSGVMLDVHQICTQCHFISTVESLAIVAFPTVEDGIPEVDGKLEPAWAFSQATAIKLSGGSEGDVPTTLGNGWETTVTMRAVFTPLKIYFALEWEDSALDSHVPEWTRDAQTGQWVMAPWTDLGQDKLAMMWETTTPTAGFLEYGGLTTCHLLNEEGGDDMPLKYTANEDEVLDLWYWMAGFTDPFDQAEDQYVNSSKDSPRGGRYPDGFDSGNPSGYSRNLQLLDNGTTVVSVPHYVDLAPVDDEDAAVLTQSEIDSKASVVPVVAVDAAGDIYYEVDGDQFKVPDSWAKPSFIISPFEADRADVEASGVWEDGKWTLEMARNLTNDNPLDVQFDNLETYYLFGMAVSDNTANGHAYHPAAFQLTFHTEPVQEPEEEENDDWIWASLSAGFFAATLVMLAIGLAIRTSAMAEQEAGLTKAAKPSEPDMGAEPEAAPPEETPLEEELEKKVEEE